MKIHALVSSPAVDTGDATLNTIVNPAPKPTGK